VVGTGVGAVCPDKPRLRTPPALVFAVGGRDIKHGRLPFLSFLSMVELMASTTCGM
jgi:hypothetical protein